MVRRTLRRCVRRQGRQIGGSGGIWMMHVASGVGVGAGVGTGVGTAVGRGVGAAVGRASGAAVGRGVGAASVEGRRGRWSSRLRSRRGGRWCGRAGRRRRVAGVVPRAAASSGGWRLGPAGAPGVSGSVGAGRGARQRPRRGAGRGDRRRAGARPPPGPRRSHRATPRPAAPRPAPAGQVRTVAARVAASVLASTIAMSSPKPIPTAVWR